MTKTTKPAKAKKATSPKAKKNQDVAPVTPGVCPRGGDHEFAGEGADRAARFLGSNPVSGLLPNTNRGMNHDDCNLPQP